MKGLANLNDFRRYSLALYESIGNGTQIPDLILVYVKALQAAGQPDPSAPQFADGYLAVASGLDNVRNPLSVNFDNFSGLLSSVTAEQLYAMSVKNGLEVDWNQFAGLGYVAGAGAGAVGATGQNVGLTGAPLVLQPSVDITLQAGQAPSLVNGYECRSYPPAVVCC